MYSVVNDSFNWAALLWRAFKEVNMRWRCYLKKWNKKVDKKQFPSVRRKPWYTEDDVDLDNSSWIQIECCIWSVGQSDPAVIRCSLATTLEWILKAGFIFWSSVEHRQMPSQHSLEDELAQWETQTKTNRNPDKDKQTKTERQTDKQVHIFIFWTHWQAACLLRQHSYPRQWERFKLGGSCLQFFHHDSHTNTQINKYTQRIPSCTNTQPYAHTYRQKQAHRSKQTHNFTYTRCVYNTHLHGHKDSVHWTRTIPRSTNIFIAVRCKKSTRLPGTVMVKSLKKLKRRSKLWRGQLGFCWQLARAFHSPCCWLCHSKWLSWATFEL